MPGEPLRSSGKTYLSVVQGNLVQRVDKDTPNARKREYEKRDKSTGVKWELVYMNWTGILQDIKIKDSDFGEQCEIIFSDAIITVPTKSRYFQEFAGKVHNADLAREITLHPYDFEDDDGKRRSGFSFIQDGEKLKNYFYGEKQGELKHGFPAVEGDRSAMDKDDWSVYFIKVKKFLIEKLADLEFAEPQASEPDDEAPEEEVSLDDLPF